MPHQANGGPMNGKTMSEQAYAPSAHHWSGNSTWKGDHISRVALCFLILVFFLTAAALQERLSPRVTLDFSDFPSGVAVVDLGQSLTVNVDAKNDGGKGVTWMCKGDACTKLTSTRQWATFYASGITGTANITATSVRQPRIHKTLKVTVYLNAVPNAVCG